MNGFPLWRSVDIPEHAGEEDLLKRIRDAGMHVEYWAGSIVRAKQIAPRTSPATARIARIRNKELGFDTPLVSIVETKRAGLARGLRFLTLEEVLALRLQYTDQPREWMRIAVETYVDEDGSALDLAMVNDGARRDVRTTWGFEQNVYQLAHEWFWVLSR